MKKFIEPHPVNEKPFSIEGENFVDAIERNFQSICNRMRIGSASSFLLEKVEAEYCGDIANIQGKTLIEFRVFQKCLAVGQEGKPGAPFVRKMQFWGTQNDLPEKHVFKRLVAQND